MAKSKSSSPFEKKESRPTFPSHYGSHASMIDAEETAKLDNPKLVVLKDEHGLYTTERNRLDSGLADPNRYTENRLWRLFANSKEKE